MSETLLAWLSLGLWCWVMAFMASGAWAVVHGAKARQGDPMRLACFITAAIFAGYTTRGLLWPGNPASGLALRLIGMADAFYILALGRAYGRGEHV